MNGLDPLAVVAFKNCMKEYIEGGGTVLFSTHLLDVAEKNLQIDRPVKRWRNCIA